MREPPCNQGMLASVVFQCQRLHLVTSDAELQSNGVKDGGTTVTRFAWLNRRCFKVYYAVYFIGIRCLRSE